MEGVDLTPLNTVGSHLVLILQAIGGVLFLVGFAVVAIMRLTAFGNEHKAALAKGAIIDLVIGLIMLLGAPIFSHILQAALNFLSTQSPN